MVMMIINVQNSIFYTNLMGLIKAIKKDDELVAEMDSLLNDESHFHLWWLGQSGYLLQWKGKGF